MVKKIGNYVEVVILTFYIITKLMFNITFTVNNLNENTYITR